MPKTRKHLRLSRPCIEILDHYKKLGQDNTKIVEEALLLYQKQENASKNVVNAFQAVGAQKKQGLVHNEPLKEPAHQPEKPLEEPGLETVFLGEPVKPGVYVWLNPPKQRIQIKPYTGWW